MIKYGKVHSAYRPKDIEVTTSMVYVAANIKTYSAVIEGYEVTGYVYDYIGYPTEEYINDLGTKNKQLEEELLDTQTALCEVYEMMGGLE